MHLMQLGKDEVPWISYIIFFRSDPPTGGSRAGQNLQKGVPSTKNLFFRPEDNSDKLKK